MKAFKFVILLGRSGSGKGTQAELLSKKFHLAYLSSGSLLRERLKENDFVGKQINEILARGGLVPTPLIFHLWLHALEKIRTQKDIQGVVFEGSPRKLYEAYLLDEMLNFYGWNAALKVFYINITDAESMKRLLGRGRNDDKVKAIQNRLAWFKEEVTPVIAFYKKAGKLITINGNQPIEKVHKDIVAKLK